MNVPQFTVFIDYGKHTYGTSTQ